MAELLPASVLNKLARAKEHFQAYFTEVDREFDGYPGKLMVQFDGRTNYIATDFSGDVPLHPRIPLIIGDCLQNLRSCLDYLVWELAIAAKSEPTKQHSFPICESPGSFEYCKKGKGPKRKGARFIGLSDDMISEIEFLQPYKDGQDFRGHRFWMLDELCNINKHRRILLARIKPGMMRSVPGTDRYERIPVSAGSHNAMEVEVVAYIAFEERGLIEGADVASILGQVIDAVERVLPNFERFFE